MDNETENKILRQEYEKLLFERDRVKKEADNYLRLYIHEFGELITELFRKKISCIEKKKMIGYCQMAVNYGKLICIEKKKMIGYCQMAVNYGKLIDIQEMNRFIENEMSDYQQQLNDMIENNKTCKNLDTISQNEYLKIKSLYRKIAKKIHPDLNSVTENNPALSELWMGVMNAYHRNDLEALERLEVQINSVLRETGISADETDIPDIEDKIQALENEIETILSTDPYQYKFILDDKELVKEKKEELSKEIEIYSNYENQLKDILKSLIERGAKFTWEN